jgi:murein DD-endopeptidase MepM/ murein hydrolase activator NlpD
MDERRLTFIVVPHGDLETKTFEISYRKLRLLGWGVFALVCVFVLMIAIWWTVAAQAARVPALERELKTFERERVKVDSLATLLADVVAQYEQVRKMLGADAPADGVQPLLPDLREKAKTEGTPDAPIVDAWPLGTERGVVTPGLTTNSNSPGLDIAVKQNSYIRAAGPGTVVAVETDETYGDHVRIDHGGGIESLYAHASKVLVKKGDKVKRLAVIALSGNSGRSTAPHLRFEIRENGVPVDPLRFVRQP